jgi:ATP-dependent 26S proteasome regulatory subunit
MSNNSDVKTKPENQPTQNNMTYSYTATEFNSALEDENRLLKEAVGSLREEIERLKSPSLMVAEVTELLNEHALIKIPNGNKFYVTISKSVKNLKQEILYLLNRRT